MLYTILHSAINSAKLMDNLSKMDSIPTSKVKGGLPGITGYVGIGTTVQEEFSYWPIPMKSRKMESSKSTPTWKQNTFILSVDYVRILTTGWMKNKLLYSFLNIHSFIYSKSLKPGIISSIHPTTTSYIPISLNRCILYNYILLWFTECQVVFHFRTLSQYPSTC